MKTIRLMALTLGLSLVMGTAATAADADPAPDYTRFSGVWVLDKDASDDPAQAMAAGRADRGEPPSGMRGGGMGGGMRGGMGGGMRGGGGGMSGGRRGGAPGERSGDRPVVRQSPERMQKAIARLEIFLDEGELDITDGLDRTRLLSCDGKPKEILTEGGGLEASAKLEDGRIIETWAGKRGPGRTIIYSLEGDGTRLVVTEKRSRPGSDSMVTVRLVYTRQE